MNGRLEHGAMLAGVLVLLLSLQFGACLGGAGVALPAALILGIGVTWLWKHFSLPGKGLWVQPVACALAVLLSVASVEVAFTSSFGEWFCPLLAAAGSGGCLAVLRRTTARCGLCNRHLATQDVVFACPRCGMHVCDETCWSYEHRRCQLCLEQRVPVLPMEDKWWLRVAGPRAHHDRCGVCRGAADQVDLRNCPKCRRPQCRDCWDFSNGECQRCGAALPDIPASLSMVVAETPGGAIRPI